jgi:pre-mRNA-processing factor 8
MPPMPPLGFPPPPPGMPSADKRMSPETLAQKSQKWIQMQKKRYGEKRKGGYVDMGKQARLFDTLFRAASHLKVGSTT